MSTVSTPTLQTSKKVATNGGVSFWRSTRIERTKLAKAMDDAGASGLIPKVDHYDGIVEAGWRVVDASKLSTRGTPVKPDPLSRNGVGVEFFQTHRGDKQNQRDFLFSIGVDDTNTAFAVQWQNGGGAIDQFFSNPNSGQVLNSLYHHELEFCSARQVTQAIQGLIFLNKGFSLNNGGGGPYFVPECALAAVDSVFAALNNAGCDCALLVSDLSDNKQLCKQVLAGAQDSMIADLEQWKAEMADTLARGAKPRINGLQTKMAQLIQSCDMYRYYEETYGALMPAVMQAQKAAYDLLAELQIKYGAK